MFETKTTVLTENQTIKYQVLKKKEAGAKKGGGEDDQHGIKLAVSTLC